MRFSRRTLAALARVISEYNTHSDLNVLAYEFGKESAAVGSTKITRCIGLIKAIEKNAKMNATTTYLSIL
jgi:hypothetical protein